MSLFAQQPPSPPPPDQKKEEAKKADEEKKPKVNEEMVVTARKREETVEEVPMSVTAPSESELRDRGAEDLEDVAANVAGFSVQNLGPGQSQVAMRGVSSGQIVRDQPGVKEQVGVYLDESVVSFSLFTPDIDLFDLSRVEVLRGPQGTLFGAGSESGTVRYITNQPQLNTSESVAELTADTIQGGGTGGSLKFAVNSPFGANAAMRLVGYYTNYGGFIDAVQPNLSVKKDVNSGYRAGLRDAFLFKPTQQLTITPRIVYQKIDMSGWNRADVFNILANPYTTTRPKVTLGPLEQFTQFKEPFNDKFMLADVNTTYDLGGGKTLTSISSYINRNVDVLRDATALTASITGGSIGLPASVYTLNAPLDDFTHARQFTEELRVSGGTKKAQWVFGGFYSDARRNYGQNLLVSGFSAASGIPTKGTLIAPTDGLYWSDLRYKDKQTALFGEATYNATDKVEVTGGLRWYDYNEHRVQTFDGIFADPGTTRGSVTANGFAPRVMASYKVSDNTRLNAQISKGFRLGGINDPLNVPLCTAADLLTFGGRDAWKDETLWNYEIGSKSRIAGGRGSFNVSAFYMDINDLQATVTAGSCSSRVVFNVPKSRSAGAEFELNLAPNDNFDFSVSASHTNSKLRSTLTSTDATGAVSIVSGIRSGARMPTVPEDQAAAAATWRWPRPTWVGYTTGTYQHIGDRYTQVGDEDLVPSQSLTTFAPNNIGGPFTQSSVAFDSKLPSYDLVNWRVGVLKGRWDTALFVNNLTNERALLSLDRERGFRARIGYQVNQPRTYGVSTRVNF
ncbi:MAG TPA: TonB-dependent receptor [Thermoanaerobaculia bacterium]